jgi:hypothetical protein
MLLSNVKTLRQIATNFCGLLRKAELYMLEFLNLKMSVNA